MSRRRNTHRSFVNGALGAILICIAAHLGSPASARADEPACPPGNLLEGKLPAHASEIRGARALVTDGVVAPEGAMWDAPLAVVLETRASVLTYDLGAPTKVEAIHLQADANDTYSLWGALDAAGPYTKIGEVGNVVESAGHGLRSRSVAVGGAILRYLRFGEGRGDDFYSLSELQAFCQLPTPFPPKLKIGAAQVQQVKKGWFDWWNDESSARWELILALVALALLTANYLLGRFGHARVGRRARDVILGVVGVVSLATYFNMGWFHFGNYIHNWDVFHYYVGAKYFRELSYDRLYECVAIADAESGLRRRVELRKMTNLRTNVLEPSTPILEQPELCKRHFTDERWDAFKHDVAFFRGRESPKRWDDVQTDHGYNATPVWNIAGTLLANTGPATHTQVFLLTLLDPAYLLATAAVIWWAFGWRVLCVALAVFATNFPSRFYWTGGAFLRWDWIFYMVAGIACLKKERPLLGGMALGYSALLRVFPIFIFIAPAIAAAVQVVRVRRLDRTYLRFFAGGALAAVLLVPLSLAFSGGPRAYVNFVQNTRKHKETPLTNAMGLRTVVSYRTKEVGRRLRSDQLVDPWSNWKAARLRAYEQNKSVYFVLVLAYLGLLGYAARRMEPWEAAALSTTFCAFGVELTSYYYVFLIAVALLYAKREDVGRTLLALTAFTQFIAWAPIGNVIFKNPRWKMPTWFDEQHTFYSYGTVVAFFIIAGRFAWAARDADAQALTEGHTVSPDSASTGALPPSALSQAQLEPKAVPAAEVTSAAGERRRGRGNKRR